LLRLPILTRFNSLEDINSYLVTNPIPLNENSTLLYSVQYGLSDSVAAINSFRDGSKINFRVEILDGANSEILGTSDNITYDSAHVFNYDNISYQLNTQGIGK